jgi:site-specific recombinase XerD
VRLSRAVDQWLSDLALQGRRASTRDAYRRHLHKLVDRVEVRAPDADASIVTADDCRAFLGEWVERGATASTVATVYSAVNGLFEWLWREERIDVNPMARIRRPRRPRPGDVAVVHVSSSDVEAIFAAAASWQEFLCVAVLAYTGARRSAATRLRWQDVDLVEGRMRLYEKGGKVADVPMAGELVAILRAAVESSEVPCAPRDYVIPNRRPAGVRRAERDDAVIYDTVTIVAQRAGVRATVHALRRAFAVAFLTTHPGAIESLQALLLHSRIDTTEQHYLRQFERAARMEAVRDFSWPPASGFASRVLETASVREKAHTGFEPVPPP